MGNSLSKDFTCINMALRVSWAILQSRSDVLTCPARPSLINLVYNDHSSLLLAPEAFPQSWEPWPLEVTLSYQG